MRCQGGGFSSGFSSGFSPGFSSGFSSGFRFPRACTSPPLYGEACMRCRGVDDIDTYIDILIYNSTHDAEALTI